MISTYKNSKKSSNDKDLDFTEKNNVPNNSMIIHLRKMPSKYVVGKQGYFGRVKPILKLLTVK